MNNIEEYIKSHELSKNDSAISFFNYPFTKRKEATQAAEENTEEAYVNFKSLSSFASNVSKPRQQDVLESTLFAQRVAQKAFPSDDQIIEWFDKYFEVLNKIGWVFEVKDWTTFETDSNVFEIDKAVLDIIGAAVTGSQLALILKTIESIKSLSENDSKFIAFEKNTHNISKGNFQLGIANETNELLSISGSCFILNTGEKINKILFFKSSKNTTEFKYKYLKATLIDEVYNKARNLIRAKLQDIDGWVSALEI